VRYAHSGLQVVRYAHSGLQVVRYAHSVHTGPFLPS
jgi:hypothetical protein